MNPKGLGKAGVFLAAGVGVSGAVVGGFWLGQSADGALGTGPLFAAVLPIVALGGAVHRLVRIYEWQRRRNRRAE